MLNREKEIRMEGRCENVVDAEEKWSEVSIAGRELFQNWKMKEEKEKKGLK